MEIQLSGMVILGTLALIFFLSFALYDIVEANGKLGYRLTVVSAAIACAAGASWLGFSFQPNAITNIGTSLGALLLVALLIERTAEVFLTIKRGDDATRKEEELRRLRILIANISDRTRRLSELGILVSQGKVALDAAVGTALAGPLQFEYNRLIQEQENLTSANNVDTLEKSSLEVNGGIDIRERAITEYQIKTRNRAFGVTFILGLLIAALGFRVLEAIVVVPEEWSKGVKAQVEKTLLQLDSKISKPGVTALNIAVELNRRETQLALLTPDQQINPKIKSLVYKTDVTSDSSAGVAKVVADLLIEQQKQEPTAADRVQAISDAVQKVPEGPQRLGFRFFDILLTAGILAGGADPIHRLMKFIRTFLDEQNNALNKIPAKTT